MKKITEKIIDEGIEHLKIAQKFETERKFHEALSYYQKAVDAFTKTGTQKSQIQHIYEKINELKTYKKSSEKGKTRLAIAIIVITLPLFILSCILTFGYSYFYLLILFIPILEFFISGIYGYLLSKSEVKIKNKYWALIGLFLGIILGVVLSQYIGRAWAYFIEGGAYSSETTGWAVGYSLILSPIILGFAGALLGHFITFLVALNKKNKKN